jgi:hypothetical protein
MSDALDQVLKLVADGRLTAEEAAPILAALDAGSTTAGPSDGPASSEPSAAGSRPDDAGARPDAGRPRFARIEVVEAGRRVVDLRIPISLGRFALGRVPGISADQVANVEAAIAAGSHGPILDVRDADGGSVRIVLE